MKRFDSTKDAIVNVISEFSDRLGGNFVQGNYYNKAIFDNKSLKGTILGCDFTNYISTLIFNIKTFEDVQINLQGASDTIAEFYFCLEGELLHSFGSNQKENNINYWQNVILLKKKAVTSKLLFKKDVHVKMVCTFFNAPEGIKNNRKTFYLSILEDSIENTEVNSVTSYFGGICGRTAKYALELTNDFDDNSHDLLFIKAAVLNTIASQLKTHQLNKARTSIKLPLRHYELDKIIALTKFIEDNLSENISLNRLYKMTGLGHAKLQSGFNHLFNKSVSKYITNARIERAAYLLQNSEVNVSEAVYSVGISSRSYFSKKFKERYGFAPSQLTKNSNY